MEAYKIAIIESLRKREKPVDVETIRTEAKIGNWNTALKHLLELFIEGKISGVRTSRGWVFWFEETPSEEVFSS